MKQIAKITRYTFIILLSYFTVYGNNKTVYIVPPEGYWGDSFFDMTHPWLNPDDRNRPFYNLRENLSHKGYKLKTTFLEGELEDFAGIIVLDMPIDKNKIEILNQYPLEKRIFIIMEPPVVSPYFYNLQYHKNYGKIFITIDDYVDNKKYFKLHYPIASLERTDNIQSFRSKKLCALINGNKRSQHPAEIYSERVKTIRFFENNYPSDFDLFGTGWTKQEYPAYRGLVLKKKDVLNNYRFCICYENSCNINGYITEKIFDIFVSGSVPVYWGATNIRDFIPENCFIPREKFETHEQLYSFLKNMPEEEYNKYLDNIGKFLKSEKAHLFSSEYFVKQITDAVLN